MIPLLRRPWLVAAVLWCMLLVSAAGAVYTRHHSRELFVELESLNRTRDELDITWGLLQTELSAFTAHAYVETVANSRLKMTAPDPALIRVVEP